jgi:gamma-glutamylcyclotransferase (GGCT)/AIG2-like uncharacterized protein YtfP
VTVRSLVFVYGTLRPGGALHDSYFGRDAERVGEATVPGSLHLVNERGWFPVWRPETPGARTTGDLLLVSPWDARAARDMEVGAGYLAVEVEATLSDGSTLPAMAFAWPQDRSCGPRIDSGDWFTHHAPRAAHSAS